MLQQKLPIDFEGLANAYGSEDVAMGMIELLDKTLSSEHSLLDILDAVLYDNFKRIQEQAHKMSGTARYAGAGDMSEIADALQKSGINRDKANSVKIFKDLIRETIKTHTYACELLKISKAEIESKLNKIYEIFKVYLGECEAERHIDYKTLHEQYGDEGMVSLMLEQGLMITYFEEDFFGQFYRHLMEKNYPALLVAAQMMKDRCNYLYLPILVEACKKLREAAKNQHEEHCFKHLLEVIDESFFMERYIMIKRIEKDRKTEKWIRLRPELVAFLEKRDDLPVAIAEMKSCYQYSTEGSRDIIDSISEVNGDVLGSVGNLTNTINNLMEESKSTQAEKPKENPNCREPEEAKVQVTKEEVRMSDLGSYDKVGKNKLQPLVGKNDGEIGHQEIFIPEDRGICSHRERMQRRSVDFAMRLPLDDPTMRNKSTPVQMSQNLEEWEKIRMEEEIGSQTKLRSNTCTAFEDTRKNINSGKKSNGKFISHTRTMSQPNNSKKDNKRNKSSSRSDSNSRCSLF